jgi:hypothetical protein
MTHPTRSVYGRHFEVLLTRREGDNVLADYYTANRAQARINAMRDFPGCKIEEITLNHRANCDALAVNFLRCF